MEPIIVKSQLSLKQLYNINGFILLRKRIIWVLTFVCLLMLYSLTLSNDRNDNIPWFAIAFMIYFVFLPFFIILAVRRNYKRIPSMSEPKVYEFVDDVLKVNGATVNASMAWSVVERVYERKNDFLGITSNGKGIHFVPKTGFDPETYIERFRSLIKSKGIKINIKA